MDVGTSVYGPKLAIRRYPADRYRPTASCWRTPVSRINRRIPFSTAMASSAATTSRDSPRRRHSGRTYIRLSSPNPSPYFIPSRSAPHPTTSPSTVMATVASISSAGSTASMSPCPSYLVAISACCSSRSRATSSSSHGTIVTATPPTGFTAPPGSSDKGAEHRREEPQAVGAAARSGGPVGAEVRLDRVLRVRHEAHNVARFVGDPGDVAAGSVRVPAGVTEHDPPLRLELVERPLVRDELPVLVLQRDGDPLADGVLPGPGGVDVLHRQLLLAADERPVVVLDHRAGQQVRLAEDLEAVADAEHREPAARGVDKGVHHGGEPADRARAQVVAVGEPAREDDGVDPVQVVVGVPEGDRGGARQPHGPCRVPVVEAAREGDDADPRGTRCGGARGHHAGRPASCTSTATTSSSTGLDSRVSAARRTASSTSAVTSPSTSSSNRLPWRTPVNPWKPSRGRAAATALPCGSRISGLGITSTTTRPTERSCAGSA